MVATYTAWILAALLLVGGIGWLSWSSLLRDQGPKSDRALVLALGGIAWKYATYAAIAILFLAVLFKL